MAFLILSLPRSRSAWLAHYLNYDPSRRVGHDISIECDRIADFVESFANGLWGSVETGAVEAWRLIRTLLPQVKLVVVKRPLLDVTRSLERQGVVPRLDELAARNVMLDELARQEGVHALSFDDLQDVNVCGWLFEHCLELEFDPEWYAKCSMINIQIDMNARLAQLERRADALAGLRAEIARETSRLTSQLGLH